MAGVTPEGFVTKTYAEILADIETAQKDLLGSDLDVSPEQPLGEINGIMSAALRELWELGAAVYAARDPDGATDQSLTRLTALTGTTRRGDQPGSVMLVVTLAAGATLPADSIASTTDPTNRWLTVESVSNTGSAQANFSVLAQQETPGPVPAAGTTISTIATPVSGWVSVTNLAAAIPGALAETDPVLRQRRESELQAAGSSPLDAIATALRNVPLVTDAVLWQNTTPSVDADGRPPHSVEAMVTGGADAAVAMALWQSVAGGIKTYAPTSVAITLQVGDEGGTLREVQFARPTAVALYVRLTARVDASRDPGDLAIATAVAAVGAALRAGEEVTRASLLVAAIGVTGVRNVTDVRIGLSALGVAAADYAVGPRQVGALLAARVEVVRA